MTTCKVRMRSLKLLGRYVILLDDLGFWMIWDLAAGDKIACPTSVSKTRGLFRQADSSQGPTPRQRLKRIQRIIESALPMTHRAENPTTNQVNSGEAAMPRMRRPNWMARNPMRVNRRALAPKT